MLNAPVTLGKKMVAWRCWLHCFHIILGRVLCSVCLYITQQVWILQFWISCRFFASHSLRNDLHSWISRNHKFIWENYSLNQSTIVRTQLASYAVTCAITLQLKAASSTSGHRRKSLQPVTNSKETKCVHRSTTDCSSSQRGCRPIFTLLWLSRSVYPEKSLHIQFENVFYGVL